MVVSWPVNNQYFIVSTCIKPNGPGPGSLRRGTNLDQGYGSILPSLADDTHLHKLRMAISLALKMPHDGVVSVILVHAQFFVEVVVGVLVRKFNIFETSENIVRQGPERRSELCLKMK